MAAPALRFPLPLFIPGVETITLTVLPCYRSKNLPSRREGVFYHLGNVALIPSVERGPSPPGEAWTRVPNLSASRSGNAGALGLQLRGPAALQQAKQ